MDRALVYNGAVPQDTDLLLTNLDAYIGLAKLSQAILGNNNLVNNATCVPTSPGSLNVVVGPCEFYSLQYVDPTAYGDVPQNVTNQIVKQGINLSATTVALLGPPSSGQSINYLIEFGFTQVDGDSQVLQYYNPVNPAAPYSGPNNTGAANNTVRYNQVSIIAKAGSPATTGTQTTPVPDAGYVGGFVVTVSYNQTAITNSNITTYISPNPGFVNETLTQKISQTTADSRYVQQSQEQSCQFVYSNDTGVANAYKATLSPSIASYVTGLTLKLKIANANTGASTLSVNNVGAVNIVHQDGTPLNANDMPAGMIAEFTFNGTNFQLNNITNLNTAIFVTQAQLQSGQYLFANDTGSTNNIIASLNPAITTYTAGMKILIKVANSNTNAVSININNLGIKNLKLQNGNYLIGGELLAGQIAEINYDGTSFQLINSANLTTINDAQSNKYIYATDIGSANNYIASMPVWALTTPALPAGARIYLKVLNTNTGASSLQLPVSYSGFSGTINLPNGTSLQGGEMVAGGISELMFDGTQYQLLNSHNDLTVAQLQENTNLYANDTGSANNYAVTFGSYALSAGSMLFVKIQHTNTAGTSQLTVNFTTHTIKLFYNGLTSLLGGELVSGMVAIFVFDGTFFQLLNPVLQTFAVSNIQNNTYTYAADTSGSANTLTVALSPAVSSYTTGMGVYVKVANTNTGASTINLNSLGAKNIITTQGNALVANQLIANGIYELEYDGTHFQLLNPSTPVGGLLINVQAFPTSGTYTQTPGTSKALVKMVGGGGGGGGAGGAYSVAGETPGGNGGNGGTTSLGSICQATGGSGGYGWGCGAGADSAGAIGGIGSGGTINLIGGGGGGPIGFSVSPGSNIPTAIEYQGGAGGNSYYGGGAPGAPMGVGSGSVSTSYNGGTNTGGGGAGAGGGGEGLGIVPAAGGAAGGYCELWWTSPSSQTITIGAGGTGGTGGASANRSTSGLAGANGGSGFMVIYEYA